MQNGKTRLRESYGAGTVKASIVINMITISLPSNFLKTFKLTFRIFFFVSF